MKKLLPEDFTKSDLLELFKSAQKPLSINEIRGFVESWKAKKKDVKKAMKELMGDGAIIRLRNNRFGLPDEMNLLVGVLWCTKSGNGFVIPEKEGEDIFVPARFIKNALHGDKVVVRVEHGSKGKREGRIIKVNERKTKNITGYIRQQKKEFFLIPDDERMSAHFLIEPGKKADILHDGDLVAAKVTKYPEDKDPECKIVKTFGSLDSANKISQFVVFKSGLSSRFSRSSELQVKGIGSTMVYDGRMDLRTTSHVTIDGEYAKDFDDAVYVEKNKSGFVLYVSIADVAYYVPKDSALDHEAYERGTSVYFPGRVIPMLPKQLSNVVCSLNPHEDRLTMTARLVYDKKGDLKQASFDNSTIRSVQRLTYHQVEKAVVKKDEKTVDTVRDIMRHLDNMGELASILKTKRTKAGNLDFDLPEPEVILDIEGGIKDILRSERLFSQGIIEEFMIAANEAVATFIANQNIPLIYRIHEQPDKEKLRNFEHLLKTLSVNYKSDKKGRLDLQAILEGVHGKEHEFLVNRILLKSMKQAKYSAVNKSHYGLALESYCHFTSPIRRYPDLICHRILKGIISKNRSDKPLYSDDDLERMSSHLSERERSAMEAERETEDRIRILFMKTHLGKVFEGIISHITSYGFFVELLDVFVEGVVMLSGLHDDYYAFEEEKYRLIGRRTHKVFRIGDHVKVRVETADVEKKILHFSLLKNKNR
jgi:ribonuclease R